MNRQGNAWLTGWGGAGNAPNIGACIAARLGPAIRLLGLLVVFGFCCANPVAAAPDDDDARTPAARAARIAVVYPELSEPYHSVFDAIIQGVEEELRAAPVLIPIKADAERNLREQLAANDVGVCIALGRSAVESAESAGIAVPVIRGALLDPHVHSGKDAAAQGISLAPDPRLLLEFLQQLAPRVTRVHVIYSDPDSEALVARAVSAGERLRIAVVPRKSRDLLDAAATYRSVISTLGPRDALWIPQDPQAVDDKVILPMLLNAAWEKNFVLFSSNADHAKRGVLYSVYPDNRALGRRLAQMARRRLDDPQAALGMEPLQDLLIAVNLRAAEHLRLGLTAKQIGTFDLTFPQR